MTPKERLELKMKMVDSIASTEHDILELKDLTKPIPPENAIGRISRMDAINNRSVNEAALRTTQDKLQKLILALDRIDEDYFGLCTKCGKNIPIGRIMLMPQSTRCVRCAS